jgi:hypothetical protein
MAIKFNPLTGNFDFTGSGGGGGSSYIDGEEATYNDLSLDAGVAPLNSAWLVRNSSGIWPFNKPGGIYIRTATLGVSRDADYTYAGTMPDVFSDAVLTIYDEASTTRTGQFNLGSVTAGQNRVLTWPDANGTIARTETFAAPPAIGNTTAAAGNFTTLTATPPAGSTALTLTGGTVTASAPLISATQTWNNAATTFVAFNLNVTETTTPGSDSLVFRLQRGGSTLFSIRRDGICPQDFQANSLRTTDTVAEGSAYKTISTGSYQFSSTTSRFGTTDVFLRRDAAGVLSQYNGTNAQEFRVYGTFTSSTNYQRLAIKTKAVTLATSSGASVATTTGFIPDGAVLVGLTTRVSTAITGATGYDIGDGSDADRWGANIGFALNTSSDNTNWTAGTIECFTAAQEVTLTAVGGNFTGGAVVIVAHYLAGEAD